MVRIVTLAIVAARQCLWRNVSNPLGVFAVRINFLGPAANKGLRTVAVWTQKRVHRRCVGGKYVGKELLNIGTPRAESTTTFETNANIIHGGMSSSSLLRERTGIERFPGRKWTLWIKKKANGRKRYRLWLVFDALHRCITHIYCAGVGGCLRAIYTLSVVVSFCFSSKCLRI